MKLKIKIKIGNSSIWKNDEIIPVNLDYVVIIMDDIEDLDKLIENITLNILNIGTKQINYYIIENLPTDVKAISHETGLTKVPVNNHLNELEKYGLLKREKGTGKVYPTELTFYFKSLIKEIEKQVKSNLSTMLPKIIN